MDLFFFFFFFCDHKKNLKKKKGRMDLSYKVAFSGSNPVNSKPPP